MSIVFLEKFNQIIGKFFLSLSWLLVTAMIATILIQVFFRYLLNNALPWPEEVARALMIWMMALVSAPAYRQGHFVAITLFSEKLPKKISQILKLIILILSFFALLYLANLSIDFFQRGFRTRAASFKIQRAWIYLAMPVCFISMLFVNLEFCLRSLKETKATFFKDKSA